MVGHDDIGSQFVMIQLLATPQGGFDDASYLLLRQIHRAVTCGVQIAIHPYESGARGKFVARRVSGMRKAAVKMPG
jgi:hypothetical protein